MSTTSGRHRAAQAYPSARRVMRACGFALLGIAGIAGYVIHVVTGQGF